MELNHRSFREQVLMPAVHPDVRALLRSQPGPHSCTRFTAIPSDEAMTPAPDKVQSEASTLAFNMPPSKGAAAHTVDVTSTGPPPRPAIADAIMQETKMEKAADQYGSHLQARSTAMKQCLTYRSCLLTPVSNSPPNHSL